MAILEDKVADTSTVYDTHGEVRYSGKVVRDSHKAGTGKFP
jgi:cell division protein FtsI (penicillin-binding protein 3)